jgi:hypothetical protein
VFGLRQVEAAPKVHQKRCDERALFHEWSIGVVEGWKFNTLTRRSAGMRSDSRLGQEVKNEGKKWTSDNHILQ